LRFELRNLIALTCPEATERILWGGLSYHDSAKGGPDSLPIKDGPRAASSSYGGSAAGRAEGGSGAMAQHVGRARILLPHKER
jgi:hypothetical protein